MERPEYEVFRSQIKKFCAEASERIKTIFNMDFSDYEWNLSLVSGEQLENFSVAYDKMKKDELLRVFISMCNQLVVYRVHFENPAEFNYRFITSMAGAEWMPFPFTKLNLKQIFSSKDLGENTIGFFMMVLNKAYTYSRRLYDELQSPDIDVDAFVDIITKNIDNIQRQPELHRCRDAFKKIKESIALLKTNFNGYYRDFVNTSDSTIIMQHFILDVSKNTTADAKISSQFRTIIGYYRKLASEQQMNPTMKAFMDQVDVNFKEMEKTADNIAKDKGKDEDKIEENNTNNVEDNDSDVIIGTYFTAIGTEDIKK
jgi:hypothetical protein